MELQQVTPEVKKMCQNGNLHPMKSTGCRNTQNRDEKSKYGG
jgi:hypothetical protein